MLYSWVSFSGVLMLLICTPLGFARLFTVIGDMVVKPKTARNLEEEYLVAGYEEECLKRQMNNFNSNGRYVSLKRTFRKGLEEADLRIVSATFPRWVQLTSPVRRVK